MGAKRQLAAVMSTDMQGFTALMQSDEVLALAKRDKYKSVLEKQLMLPSGLVVVNDDFRNRVIVIDPKTNKVVWQYGQTDVAGSSPGLLYRPDGMDFVPYDVAVQTPVLRRYLVRILGDG